MPLRTFVLFMQTVVLAFPAGAAAAVIGEWLHLRALVYAGYALVLLFVLGGIAGGVLGVLVALGRFHPRCPFCGKPGDLVGPKGRTAFGCRGCGTIRSRGILWWLRFESARGKGASPRVGPPA